MPPSIPVRVPASAAANGWMSGLCIRAFSSTPTTEALGPQSPNYIEVPKPAQPTYPVNPEVKGHLPVPRDVFKTRSTHPKHSSIFLNRSTKTPKDLKQPGPYSKDGDYRLYKQRLADKRREALREGVQELHERKVTTEAQYLAQIQAQGAVRRNLATAPRRNVDVLTETSTNNAVRDFLAHGLAPRQDMTEARRRAYLRRNGEVRAARGSRLHDLYTNAREFIVNESQLDEAIENAFGTEESPVGWDTRGNMGPRSDGKEGLSPWHGPMPEGVGDMMQKLRGGEGVGLAKERVRKVAEELTGGKM